MSNCADCSTAIAQIQVWVAVLEHLEPGGKWCKLPLLQARAQNPYDLSPDDYTALAEQLQREYEQALKRFLNRHLAGHRKDPQRIQLEIPGLNYGA